MIDSLNLVLKSWTWNKKRFCLLPDFGAWNRSGSFSLVSVFLSPLKFHFRKTLKNLRLLLISSRVFAIILLRIRINFRTWLTRTGCPEAPLSPKKYQEILSLAKRAHKLLGCRGITRSDFRFFKNKFYLLEINTQPGMTKLSLVPEIARYCGIKFEDLVVWMIKNAKFNKWKSYIE